MKLEELKDTVFDLLNDEDSLPIVIDTCLTAQDEYKTYLDYFRIEY